MPGTPVDIDRELLREARALLGAPSDQETVRRALQHVVAMQRQRLALARIRQRRFLPAELRASTIEYPLP